MRNFLKGYINRNSKEYTYEELVDIAYHFFIIYRNRFQFHMNLITKKNGKERLLETSILNWRKRNGNQLTGNFLVLATVAKDKEKLNMDTYKISTIVDTKPLRGWVISFKGILNEDDKFDSITITNARVATKDEIANAPKRGFDANLSFVGWNEKTKTFDIV